MKIKFLPLLLTVVCLSANAQPLPPKADIMATLKKVNDYWLSTHTNPGIIDWMRAAYFTGNMAVYKISPDKKYLDYANLWGTNANWGLLGGVATRHADNHCVGQTYIDLYETDVIKIPKKIADITTSIHTMATGAKSDDWSWVDALYMAMPVFTRLGVMKNDISYSNKMYALYYNTKNTRKLYDQTKHLWFRDQSFLPPRKNSNGKDIVWSRGNGWVFAAHARVLSHLPLNDPHRNEYIQTFKDMAAALKSVQRSDGFWNVNLVDPNDYGGPETSGTAFFTYGMAWGINNGFLDSATYTPIVAKAWNGMVKQALHPNGKVGYIQAQGKEPQSAQPVTFQSNWDFGVGAFLLSGSEVFKLASQTVTSAEETDEAIPFHLYPNPANEEVTIQCSQQTVTRIVISDLTGRIIMENNERFEGSKTINTAGLSNGIFFIKISGEQKEVVEKLIIRK